MYQVLSNIVIQQIPSDQYPDRKRTIVFSFLSKYEGQSTWEELTQTIKIELPKKVKVRFIDWSGSPFDSFPKYTTGIIDFYKDSGNHSNIGGFDGTPTLLRGDLITFNIGYRTHVRGQETTYMTGGADPTGNYKDGIPPEFKGFITNVNPKLPFTIDCEDNMWLLKQMPTPAKQWPNGTTINDIVKTVIRDSQELPIVQRYKGYVDLQVSDHSVTDLKFNVNNITTTRGSLAAFMARIRSEWHILSYFRGDSLRVGYTVYNPDDTIENTFTFQQNIISDNLSWQRKDDLVLSMIAKSHYSMESDRTTADGQPKTKTACVEILIYNQAGQFLYVTKEKGKDFPTNYLKDIGERYSFNVYSFKTAQELFALGVEQLKKKYYNGFKGSFTTVGIPYVKHGDTVKLVDKVLPERSGAYKVKGVKSFGGFDSGLRREITLDYKIEI